MSVKKKKKNRGNLAGFKTLRGIRAAKNCFSLLLPRAEKAAALVLLLSCSVFLYQHSFCPRLQDADTIKSSDKICRQLIYHLTPHSKWLRQSMSRRKSQAW